MNCLKTLRRLHENEEGQVSLENVGLLAIAAVVLLAVVTFGQEALDYLGTTWDDLVRAADGVQ
jgi:Flp pilus assembly pilin Flp